MKHPFETSWCCSLTHAKRLHYVVNKMIFSFTVYRSDLIKSSHHIQSIWNAGNQTTNIFVFTTWRLARKMCQVCDIENSEIFHYVKTTPSCVQTLSNGKCSTNSSNFYQIVYFLCLYVCAWVWVDTIVYNTIRYDTIAYRLWCMY